MHDYNHDSNCTNKLMPHQSLCVRVSALCHHRPFLREQKGRKEKKKRHLPCVTVTVIRKKKR
jgi:hypothetical protein